MNTPNKNSTMKMKAFQSARKFGTFIRGQFQKSPSDWLVKRNALS